MLGSKKLSPRTWQTPWSQDQARAVPLPCTGVRMVAGVVGQDPLKGSGEPRWGQVGAWALAAGCVCWMRPTCLKNNNKIISLRAIFHLESRLIDGFVPWMAQGSSGSPRIDAHCSLPASQRADSIVSPISASPQKGYTGHFGQREQGWEGNTTIDHLAVQSQYHFFLFFCGWLNN